MGSGSIRLSDIGMHNVVINCIVPNDLLLSAVSPSRGTGVNWQRALWRSLDGCIRYQLGM